MRRVRLVEKTCLEIDAGRETHVGVARPRVAVDAAMLAAAIGVDGILEGNIRRIVARDDMSRPIGLDGRGDALGLLLRVPAIVHVLEIAPLEAAGGVRERASSLQ